MRVLPRLGWKPLFYGAVLPLLRRLGPSRCDAALGALGRAVSSWPPRRDAQRAALDEARAALGGAWPEPAARDALAANVARFTARDLPLEGADDAALSSRFDVSGSEHLDAALSGGRGVIVLGCHFGAYLAAVHWLLRRGVPMRLLAQKPSHVSPTLAAFLDRDDGPHPQSDFFLRRRMPAGEGAARLVRARAALRDGLAVYFCGDVPWPSSQARPGRFLGRTRPFQAAWADLAAISGAAVLPVFAHHEPGGRYALTIDPPFPADPASAVPRYLARLEREIAARPGEAVAHLSWPCYREAMPAVAPAALRVRPA